MQASVWETAMETLVQRMYRLRMRDPPPASIMAQQEPNGDFPYLPSGAAEGKRSATFIQNKLCYIRYIISKTWHLFLECTVPESVRECKAY